jgi:hypothetical protein
MRDDFGIAKVDSIKVALTATLSNLDASGCNYKAVGKVYPGPSKTL